MTLTKTGTDGIKDDAVTLDKLAHGTSSQDGKFLRANNGAAPSFESIPAGITINNQADNRLITATGTTDTLNAEANAIINSSGHMGLGVTPNTNLPVNADFKFLQVGTGASLFGRGSGDEDRGGIAVNYYHTGSAEKYLGNGNSSGIILGDGDIDFFTAGANSSGVDAAMSKTIAMRIASTSGNVGIGVTDVKGAFQVNSNKNAETDRHNGSNYHLFLRNPEDDTGEACGLAFSVTSNSTKTGAAIMHEREGGGSQGSLQFYTNGDGNSVSERMRIKSDGDVSINDGNLVFASGHGIDFSATADATNKTGELFSDYEEGTWTPAVEGTYVSGTPTYHSRNGLYTKIGRMVYIQGRIHFNSISYSNTSQIFELTGLPFNAATAGGGTPGVVGATVWSQLEWVGASQSSYGTNNDVVLSPTVSGYNKIRFFTCSQDKYYLSELKNSAVDGNAAMFQFAFYYTT